MKKKLFGILAIVAIVLTLSAALAAADGPVPPEPGCVWRNGDWLCP